MNTPQVPGFDLSPQHALAFAMLSQAKKDASTGDLCALAWLITEGVRIERMLVTEHPMEICEEPRSHVLDFCRKLWRDIQKNKKPANWYKQKQLLQAIRHQVSVDNE